MPISIQGSLTIRRGNDWLRLHADRRQVDLHTGSWRTLRDIAAMLAQVKAAVKGAESDHAAPPPPAPGSAADTLFSGRSARSALAGAVSGTDSLAEAAARVRGAGFTVRLFIAERLVAEVGPTIKPNLPARLMRVAPLRVYAAAALRAWLGR